MIYKYMRHDTLLDTNEEGIFIAGIDEDGNGKFTSVVVATNNPQSWVADEANRAQIENALASSPNDDRAKLWVLAHSFRDNIDVEVTWLEQEFEFLTNQIPLLIDPIVKRLAQNQRRILRQNEWILRYIKRDMRQNLKDDRV